MFITEICFYIGLEAWVQFITRVIFIESGDGFVSGLFKDICLQFVHKGEDFFSCEHMSYT